MDAASPPPLVGRAARARGDRRCAAPAARAAGRIVAIEGEPGIGKSRLLAHLAARGGGGRLHGARARAPRSSRPTCPTRCSTEALDRHLAEPGERRVARLGLADPARARRGAARARRLAGEPAAADRHRTHRALRDLLERLAAARPLVALPRRRALGGSRLARRARGARAPPARRAGAARGRRARGPAAARAGRRRSPARCARTASSRCARAAQRDRGGRAGRRGGRRDLRAGGRQPVLPRAARAGARDAAGGPGWRRTDRCPPAVAAALAGELAALTPDARRLLDAAAVAGDPFEPGLAGEVAELPEPAALAALDELLDARAGAAHRRAAPVRLPPPGRPPRRLRRRRPRGWRLGAHARAARGARAPRRRRRSQRAHHVEHAARPGDEAADRRCSRPPRASCSRRRRRPRPASTPPRCGCCPIGPEARAADRAAAPARRRPGRRGRSRWPRARRCSTRCETAAPGERLALTVALANQEWWLGGHEDARRRLQVALAELPAQPSPDRVRLRLALGLMALLACDLRDAQAQTSDARDDARAIGDPVFELAALAGGALAAVVGGRGPRAARRLEAVRGRARAADRASSSRRGCRRSGCTAARAARSATSTPPSRTSSAVPRSPRRRAASACC